MVIKYDKIKLKKSKEGDELMIEKDNRDKTKQNKD